MSYFKKVQLQDGYGFSVENTPLDEQRVVIPTRLVGSTFEGATVDTSFWTAAVSGTGAASSQLDGVYTLASGTTTSRYLWMLHTLITYVGGVALMLIMGRSLN
jgi:hypothetical protein